MSKLKSIISGWKNLILKDEELEPLFLNRMKYGCNGCKYNVLIGGIKVCDICKCPLASKTRSLEEECPHPEGSRWLPIPKYDEQGIYRLRGDLPENLRHYFSEKVIEEAEWQEFVDKHK